MQSIQALRERLNARAKIVHDLVDANNEKWTPELQAQYDAGMAEVNDLKGQIARLHWPIYDNFHFDAVQLNDEKVMVEWISKNGIDPEKFLSIYRSPEIQAKLDEVRKLMMAYDIRSVPTMVIDGKYLSTARMAGGTRQLILVVDNLAKLARKERPR